MTIPLVGGQGTGRPSLLLVEQTPEIDPSLYAFTSPLEQIRQ
jgi:hypothetical protein